VVAPQIEPEGFGPLDQPRDVRVAAQQIVDELASRRLLLADHLPPRGLMPFDQHLHGVVHDAQDSLRGGAHLVPVPRSHDRRYLLPQPPSCREVQVDRLVGVHALLRCTSTKPPNS
jgi:hypothetical protein